LQRTVINHAGPPGVRQEFCLVMTEVLRLLPIIRILALRKISAMGNITANAWVPAGRTGY
jgi:hypothetical protein